MWPFKSTRLASDAEVLASLTKLHAKVAALEDGLAALQDKHERLRGRVYATGQHKPDPATPAPRLDKAAVLREFGFVPGKPAPHNGS